MEQRLEEPDMAPIYIGLGANLPHPEHGSPQQTLKAALAELDRRGVQVRRLSPWYRTAPVPASNPRPVRPSEARESKPQHSAMPPKRSLQNVTHPSDGDPPRLHQELRQDHQDPNQRMRQEIADAICDRYHISRSHCESAADETH